MHDKIAHAIIEEVVVSSAIDSFAGRKVVD